MHRPNSQLFYLAREQVTAGVRRGSEQKRFASGCSTTDPGVSCSRFWRRGGTGEEWGDLDWVIATIAIGMEDKKERAGNGWTGVDVGRESPGKASCEVERLKASLSPLVEARQ